MEEINWNKNIIANYNYCWLRFIADLVTRKLIFLRCGCWIFLRCGCWRGASLTGSHRELQITTVEELLEKLQKRKLFWCEVKVVMLFRMETIFRIAFVRVIKLSKKVRKIKFGWMIKIMINSSNNKHRKRWVNSQNNNRFF